MEQILGDNMSIYIDDDLLERIKDRANIVELISEYLTLEKRGSNYVGLCPFHSEKTPSFTVADNKDFFHCFGCGKSGDVLTFIMERENLDFPRAVEFLANKYGIEIKKRTEIDTRVKNKRDRAYEINREAARFFYMNLNNNKKALEYLKNRGLKDTTIRRFGLGYSLDDWEGLHKHLTSLGFSSLDMEELGLVGARSKGNGYYDKFRNRIMFPIIDTRSRVIGFGGRVLDDQVPKYLNSQKTLVFDKGNFLYGLNMIMKESNREDIILVEGYMDVISFYNNGINYSVASLGTAFTDRQAKLLKRYGRNIYLCYDSDLAGQEATDKAINILLKEGVRPKIIVLDGYGDPDDFFKENKKDDFIKKQEDAYHFIDYKIMINKSKYDLNDIEDKIKFIKTMARELNLIDSSVEKDIYMNKLAEELSISKEAIKREMLGSRGKKKNRGTKEKQYSKETVPIKVNLPPGSLVAEADLINLMIYNKKYYEELSDMEIINDFTNDTSVELVEIIGDLYIEKDFIEKKDVYDVLKKNPNIDSNLSMSILEKESNFSVGNLEKVLEDLVKTLRINKLNLRRNYIREKIEHIESSQGTDAIEEISELFKELMVLNEELESIRYDDRG